MKALHSLAGPRDCPRRVCWSLTCCGLLSFVRPSARLRRASSSREEEHLDSWGDSSGNLCRSD